MLLCRLLLLLRLLRLSRGCCHRGSHLQRCLCRLRNRLLLRCRNGRLGRLRLRLRSGLLLLLLLLGRAGLRGRGLLLLHLHLSHSSCSCLVGGLLLLLQLRNAREPRLLPAVRLERGRLALGAHRQHRPHRDGRQRQHKATPQHHDVHDVPVVAAHVVLVVIGRVHPLALQPVILARPLREPTVAAQQQHRGGARFAARHPAGRDRRKVERHVAQPARLAHDAHVDRPRQLVVLQVGEHGGGRNVLVVVAAAAAREHALPPPRGDGPREAVAAEVEVRQAQRVGR
mmetsp:Transcript_17707/g.44595  ORF Transcript_17707/g.44595 Transcript_17707/m.44595 type:complete len:285 (-) Transcript_17707:782-1636(-)